VSAPAPPLTDHILQAACRQAAVQDRDRVGRGDRIAQRGVEVEGGMLKNVKAARGRRPGAAPVTRLRFAARTVDDQVVVAATGFEPEAC